MIFLINNVLIDETAYFHFAMIERPKAVRCRNDVRVFLAIFSVNLQ
jgi:hypothetical protein